jgi:hypothetical protein
MTTPMTMTRSRSTTGVGGCGCGRDCWAWQRPEVWLWSPLLNDPQRMGDAYRQGAHPALVGVTSDTEHGWAWRAAAG